MDSSTVYPFYLYKIFYCVSCQMIILWAIKNLVLQTLELSFSFLQNFLFGELCVRNFTIRKPISGFVKVTNELIEYKEKMLWYAISNRNDKIFQDKYALILNISIILNS